MIQFEVYYADRGDFEIYALSGDTIEDGVREFAVNMEESLPFSVLVREYPNGIGGDPTDWYTVRVS